MSKTISSSPPITTVNGIDVNTNFLHTHNCNVQNSRNVSYIVVHYTGNGKDAAVSNAQYFYNRNCAASAHYFVDEKQYLSKCSGKKQGVALRQ